MPPHGLVVVLNHEGRLCGARRGLGERGARAQKEWNEQPCQVFHGESPSPKISDLRC